MGVGFRRLIAGWGGRQALVEGDVLLVPAPHSAPPAILFHAVVKQVLPDTRLSRL